MDKRNIYNVWFPKTTKEIVIVVSEEASEKKSVDANTTSENYAYIDNVGDKDTLFEVAIFLSRIYPGVALKRLFPREFNAREDLNKNLVIIGGPAHNDVYSRIKDKFGAKIKYDLDKWTISLDDKEYESQYCENKGMERDYGSFSSFKNPFMHEHKVILINGISTFGTLGAFYAFSDRDDADENYQFINSLGINRKDFIGFETLLCVTAHNCDLHDCTKVYVDCPLIEECNTIVYTSQVKEDNDMSIKNKKDIGIITVLDEETLAVVKCLNLVQCPLTLGNRLYYEGNIVGSNGKKYSIILTQQLSQGESSVVSAFDAMSTEFNPRFLFLVGIAGGISEEIDYCSVVVANQIIGYDLSKDTESGIVRRGDVYRIDASLVPFVQKIIHKSSINPITAAQGSKTESIDVKFGNIASGNVVISNSLSDIKSWIQNFNDKTYAVEMEGYGFSVAAYEKKLNDMINNHCNICIIRGISDLADKNKSIMKNYRKPAIKNAAIILQEIISSLF